MSLVVLASDISGMSKPAKELKIAEGNKTIGKTMLWTVPYAASEEALLEPLFSSPIGISICSIEIKPERKYVLNATGREIDNKFFTTLFLYVLDNVSFFLIDLSFTYRIKCSKNDDISLKAPPATIAMQAFSVSSKAKLLKIKTVANIFEN